MLSANTSFLFGSKASLKMPFFKPEPDFWSGGPIHVLESHYISHLRGFLLTPDLSEQVINRLLQNLKRILIIESGVLKQKNK